MNSLAPSLLLPTGMTPQDVGKRAKQEIARRLAENRISQYRPYAKQREFHDAGRTHRERLFRAGNQLGKSFSGGAEAAFHLTGDYPTWWQGRRWERPTRGWIGGPSGELVRDGAQRVLLGPPGEWGTGAIPKAAIIDVTRAAGVRDMADTVTVKHVTNGISRVKFKTYDQGRLRWQAETLDWVWCDEEPPMDLYTEALSRTNATGGMLWLTFTPLLGVSDVVMRFIKEQSPDRADIVMTIDDAEHIPAAQRQTIIDSYPEHEREARTRGVPILGSGRVFPLPRAAVSVEPFAVPDYWRRLAALDFGADHPTAAVRIAHDTEADVIYVTDAYRAKGAEVMKHAVALRSMWGKEIPVAWPHDGLSHKAGMPDNLANLYRKYDLRLLPDPSSYDDTRRNHVEAGVMDMLDRMTSGRLKVFSHLNDWFEEFELYHRKDGVLTEERDDLMDATRYAVMSLRFARATAEAPRNDRYSKGYGRGGGASAWSS